MQQTRSAPRPDGGAALAADPGVRQTTTERRGATAVRRYSTEPRFCPHLKLQSRDRSARSGRAHMGRDPITEALFLETDEGFTLVVDGNHVRPATRIELALAARLSEIQSLCEATDRNWPWSEGETRSRFARIANWCRAALAASLGTCNYQGFGSGDNPTTTGCVLPKGHEGCCSSSGEIYG